MFEELFENDRPAWSPLASSGVTEIKAHDYTDPNFIRRSMYEISSGDKYRMYAWTWNGTKLIDPIAIIANRQCFPELCLAMPKYSKNNVATFVSTKNRLVLIGIDGSCLPRPIAYTASTFNDNPANDWELIRNLPEYIENIRRRYSRTPDGRKSHRSFKAWINVNSGQVVQVPVHEKFDSIIKQKATVFGVEDQKTVLHARIKAERSGWVAFGVNAEKADKVTAIVQAMTGQLAKKAARAMYEVRKGDWDELVVITNDSKDSYVDGGIDDYCGVAYV